MFHRNPSPLTLPKRTKSTKKFLQLAICTKTKKVGNYVHVIAIEIRNRTFGDFKFQELYLTNEQQTKYEAKYKY
jgi:hypothetical protein